MWWLLHRWCRDFICSASPQPPQERAATSSFPSLRQSTLPSPEKVGCPLAGWLPAMPVPPQLPFPPLLPMLLLRKPQNIPMPSRIPSAHCQVRWGKMAVNSPTFKRRLSFTSQCVYLIRVRIGDMGDGMTLGTKQNHLGLPHSKYLGKCLAQTVSGC